MWQWNSWSMLYQAPFENAGPSVPVIPAVFQTLHHFDNYTAWKLFSFYSLWNYNEVFSAANPNHPKILNQAWNNHEIGPKIIQLNVLGFFYLPSGFECLGCNGVTFAGFPLPLCGPEMQPFYKTTKILWVFTWLQELGFNGGVWGKSTLFGLVIKLEVLALQSVSHSKFVYKGNIVIWRERTEFPSVLFWLERNSSQRVNFTSQSQNKAYSASEVMHRPGCVSLCLNLLHATLKEAAEVIVAEIV